MSRKFTNHEAESDVNSDFVLLRKLFAKMSSERNLFDVVVTLKLY